MMVWWKKRSKAGLIGFEMARDETRFGFGEHVIADPPNQDCTGKPTSNANKLAYLDRFATPVDNPEMSGTAYRAEMDAAKIGESLVQLSN